ncbi:MAG: RES family NAD+ phosphorylase [Deltaproteobacteria bacterium]|nr:RES family NAD+ phosphorylase [Deltaproteobacteria bacterium]
MSATPPLEPLEPLWLLAWRVVDGQHMVSTRKLVDSDDEQELLDAMLDAAGPPSAPDVHGLHPLLARPLRLPPLPYGSRFGSRHERGIWYGALEPRTAFAEAAFYRLLFFSDTEARLDPMMLDLLLFSVPVTTRHGVDLTKAPFDAVSEVVTSRTSYVETQRLGSAMRESDVEAFLYPSARDPEGGTNVGVFSPRAFAAKRPASPAPWVCHVGRDAVELSDRGIFERRRIRFPRQLFETGGELILPASA